MSKLNWANVWCEREREREGGRERTQRFYNAIICHLILLFVLIFLDIVVVAAGYKIKIQIQIKAE